MANGIWHVAYGDGIWQCAYPHIPHLCTYLRTYGCGIVLSTIFLHIFSYCLIFPLFSVPDCQKWPSSRVSGHLADVSLFLSGLPSSWQIGAWCQIAPINGKTGLSSACAVATNTTADSHLFSLPCVHNPLEFLFVAGFDRSSHSDGGLLYIDPLKRPLFEISSISANILSLSLY